MGLRSLLVAAAAVVAIAAPACGEDVPERFPIRPAPAFRHGALADGLAEDARVLAFADGDWEDDLGDAPFYGLAWLARRAESYRTDGESDGRRSAAAARAVRLLQGNVLDGDVQEKVTAALGLAEHIASSEDRSTLPVLDDFVDRLDTLTRATGDYIEAAGDSWALRTYGPTAVTALVALLEVQYALLVGGPRAVERLERARAIDARIGERAFSDLLEGYTGAAARGYAFAPGNLVLSDYPNLAMLLLKSRLYRMTKIEDYRLEARAIYVALQPLKLADAPARYASPYANASLGIATRDLSTLSSQNYLALGLLVLFEITGSSRFIDEADRVLDGIAAMRGPWCRSHVHPTASATCAPACAGGEICAGVACAADRCASGLLHHVVDGRLAAPGDGTVFCAGCNLQTLYVLGYRRSLAGDGW